MGLPRFAAESSLYRSQRHYFLVARSGFGHAVVPQLPCGNCYRDDTGNCVHDCYIPCPPGVKPNGCGNDVTLPCRPSSRCGPPPPPCPLATDPLCSPLFTGGTTYVCYYCGQTGPLAYVQYCSCNASGQVTGFYLTGDAYLAHVFIYTP